MSKIIFQKFRRFCGNQNTRECEKKIVVLWERETGRCRISGSAELREKQKYQNEKEDTLRIDFNGERNVVLLFQNRELHGGNIFGGTGLHSEKGTYIAKMRSGKLQIMKNGRRIRRIYAGGREAA